MIKFIFLAVAIFAFANVNVSIVVIINWRQSHCLFWERERETREIEIVTEIKNQFSDLLSSGQRAMWWWPIHYIHSRFLCNHDILIYLIQIIFFFSGSGQTRSGPSIEGEWGQKQSSETSRQHHHANGVRSCRRCSNFRSCSQCHRYSKCGWWCRSWQFRCCNRRIKEIFEKWK